MPKVRKSGRPNWDSSDYRWVNFGGWGHGISIISDNNDSLIF